MRKKCTKQRFPSKRAARMALHDIHTKGGLLLPCRAYRCATCKSYHLTSKPVSRRMA